MQHLYCFVFLRFFFWYWYINYACMHIRVHKYTLHMCVLHIEIYYWFTNRLYTKSPAGLSHLLMLVLSTSFRYMDLWRRRIEREKILSSSPPPISISDRKRRVWRYRDLTHFGKKREKNIRFPHPRGQGLGRKQWMTFSGWLSRTSEDIYSGVLLPRYK